MHNLAWTLRLLSSGSGTAVEAGTLDTLRREVLAVWEPDPRRGR